MMVSTLVYGLKYADCLQIRSDRRLCIVPARLWQLARARDQSQTSMIRMKVAKKMAVTAKKNLLQIVVKIADHQPTLSRRYAKNRIIVSKYGVYDNSFFPKLGKASLQSLHAVGSQEMLACWHKKWPLPTTSLFMSKLFKVGWLRLCSKFRISNIVLRNKRCYLLCRYFIYSWQLLPVHSSSTQSSRQPTGLHFSLRGCWKACSITTGRPNATKGLGTHLQLISRRHL